MDLFGKLLASISIFISSIFSPQTTVPSPIPTAIISPTPTVLVSATPAINLKPTSKPTSTLIGTIKPTGRAPLAPIPCEGRDGGDCARITPLPTASVDKLYDTRYKNVTIILKMKTTPLCSQNTSKTVEIHSSGPNFKIFENDTTSSIYRTTTSDSITFAGLYSGYYKFVIKYCTDKQIITAVFDDENMLPGKTITKTIELPENPNPNTWYD